MIYDSNLIKFSKCLISSPANCIRHEVNEIFFDLLTKKVVKCLPNGKNKCQRYCRIYVKQDKLFFHTLNTAVEQNKIIQPLTFWEISYAMNNIYMKNVEIY